MATAEEHYSSLLARHYTWMFGVSFDEKVAEQELILAKVFDSVAFVPSGLALDLGCGSGFQAFALSRLGFTPVLAIDSSPELLAELESRGAQEAILTRNGNIRDLARLTTPGSATAAVCMGDTITHLPAKSAVEELFVSVLAALAPGGLFILTWRDLSIELSGTDRFIPVHNDDEKLMTCFLDYLSPDTVLVQDLIYERQPEGWSLKKSSYPKLRLSADWLTEALTHAGFTVRPPGAAGRLLLLVAAKP